jgi:hypothetical protein
VRQFAKTEYDVIDLATPEIVPARRKRQAAAELMHHVILLAEQLIGSDCAPMRPLAFMAPRAHCTSALTTCRENFRHITEGLLNFGFLELAEIRIATAIERDRAGDAIPVRHDLSAPHGGGGMGTFDRFDWRKTSVDARNGERDRRNPRSWFRSFKGAAIVSDQSTPRPARSGRHARMFRAKA